MKFVNLTPHPIMVETTNHRPWGHPDGEDWGTGKETILPSGEVARVETIRHRLDPIRIHADKDWDILYLLDEQKFGEIKGLPEPADNTLYIVSLVVLAAATDKGRTDCVAPDTANATRNKEGHIVSVPGFVKQVSKEQAS